MCYAAALFCGVLIDLVHAAFRQIDRDNTGDLEREEFEEMCTRFGCEMSTREMDQVHLFICDDFFLGGLTASFVNPITVLG